MNTEQAVQKLGSGWTEPRYLSTGFQTLIVIVGQVWLSLLESWGQFATAVVFSIATESMLSRLYRSKWPNPVSPYMTGVSIGILVRSPAWWPYAVGSALAIAQKYAFQFRGRHLFNPSNFGLCLLLLAVPETVVALSKQLTNMPGVVIFLFLFGVVVIGRLGRLDVVFTYVAAFILLGFLRSAINGTPLAAEVAPVLGPLYQIFIFFMVTDPRTTPATRRGRVIYALAVAVTEGLLRFLRNQNAPFFAAFVVSPVAVIWEASAERSGGEI
ncbi:MAG: RnfABCDGE type electron transport complex subunit D [Candidatus Binatia bacterium]